MVKVDELLMYQELGVAGLLQYQISTAVCYEMCATGKMALNGLLTRYASMALGSEKPTKLLK
jgi:hypothetical protein